MAGIGPQHTRTASGLRSWTIKAVPVVSALAVDDNRSHRQVVDLRQHRVADHPLLGQHNVALQTGKVEHLCHEGVGRDSAVVAVLPVDFVASAVEAVEAG